MARSLSSSSSSSSFSSSSSSSSFPPPLPQTFNRTKKDPDKKDTGTHRDTQGHQGGKETERGKRNGVCKNKKSVTRTWPDQSDGLLLLPVCMSWTKQVPVSLPLTTIPKSTLPSTQVIRLVWPCNHCKMSMLSWLVSLFLCNFLFNDFNTNKLLEEGEEAGGRAVDEER